ncbi:MAG: bacteriocin family protein [Burkholderiaceae bacterium]|uniref:family 1 encapsulin nanocompartment shell protein n=1 Tax=Ottowia sp. TaxID=1898956 RepID=UPI002BA96885|nr:family 1 encapsulin nanocompartment shell protein [Ottowia sp.]MCP5257214.1 bacteriocin family protein [Burkholderiaceae bacterium]HPR43160.1 family 1 encapsulin nanocompartment shell protein [Ottowia sp.]HRW72850.1 family 1 encapsulin nanocompartment shell protein [Ottowia sp.]
MNNLHRELAPVSDGAWAQIEEEVARTFRRNLAGRRAVDVEIAEAGSKCSAIGTGHLKALKAPQDGVIARQRIVMPLVELRVPFELAREAIDDVERGADDSDWQPAKNAAEQLAYAEDRAIFLGYAAAGIEGIREGTSNPVLALPAKAVEYPDVVAAALKQLKLAGVDGPYVAVLGAEAYTALQEANDKGYPVLNHIQRLVGSENIIWAPAIEGAYVISTRGGDFELNLGRDLSIGYLSHTDSKVRLYLEETLTFRLLTAEAAVAILPKA